MTFVNSFLIITFCFFIIAFYLINRIIPKNKSEEKRICEACSGTGKKQTAHGTRNCLSCLDTGIFPPPINHP